MKKAIITYIYAGYDQLKDPVVVTPGWDYLCFSDTALSSTVWEPRVVPTDLDHPTDPKRLASFIKIMHHVCLPEDYDVCVMIDGSMQINTCLDRFLEEFWSPDTDMTIARHPERTCVFDEAEAVLDLQFDDPETVQAQMGRYAKEGLPRHYGLYGSRLMVKNHHSPRLHSMCALWARELARGSRRDQLSLPYALWRQEQAPEGPVRLESFAFDEVYRKRKLFEITPHLGSAWYGEPRTTSAA